MKSILVIGLGRFGGHLAKKMLDLGNDVMVVDKDEDTIENFGNIFTDSFIGDCRQEGVLRSLGINNFDICFVAVERDFQSSLEITSLLKDFGARRVVSLANRDKQALFLKKIGADDVVDPEKEIAEKTAVRYNSNHIFDLFQLTNNYTICEIPVLDSWYGKTIPSIDVRNKYKINIIAIKTKEKVTVLPSSSYVFDKNDHVLVIGNQEDIDKITV
jgi:trk system potassium uptake protein TrkA